MTPADPVAIVRGALNKPMLSKEDCLAVWVAVLEGVRIPTAEMIEVGDAAHAENSGYQYSAVEESFTAMIDALLAESRG